MKTIILLSIALIFSSCMHVGMMETHGNDQSGKHQITAEAVLEKEVTSGEIKATAIFPPLQIGKQAVFALKLSDIKSTQPISGAQVSFHSTYLHNAESHGGHDAHMMHGEMDSKPARPNTNHAVSFDQEIRESAEPGLYTVAFTASQSGEHRLMFHVSAIGGKTLDQELVIEATRNVASNDASHDGMMHGMGGVSDYAIVGAVLMGAMMLVVLATGGRMF